MTTFGKIFTIFITLASLAFMGFAVVTYHGGPNYQAEQVEKLPDYVLKVSTDKPPKWAVETRRLAETVNTSTTTLPGVIVAARKHLDQQLDEEIKPLDGEILAVEARIAEAKKLIEIDLAGLKKREKELQAELDALLVEIKDVSDQGIKKSQESYAVRDETARRREDVFRLWNQLEEIRTDYYRAVAQAEKLDDLLIRVRGSIDRSQRRNDQLRSVAKTDDETP